MRTWLVSVVLLCALGTPSSARADRTQVYSIRDADCGSCGDAIKAQLKKVKVVKKAEFDVHKVELTVRLDDGVPDAVVMESSTPYGSTGAGELVPERVRGQSVPIVRGFTEAQRSGRCLRPSARS